MAPQARLLAGDASSRADRANVLAREPSADDIHGNSVCPEPFCCEGSDILIDRDAGPVLSQHGSCKRVNLAERDCSHSCSLKPEGEAANAREKVEDIHVTYLHISAKLRTTAMMNANRPIPMR